VFETIEGTSQEFMCVSFIIVRLKMTQHNCKLTIMLIENKRSDYNL